MPNDLPTHGPGSRSRGTEQAPGACGEAPSAARWPRWIGPLSLLLAVAYQVSSAFQPLEFLLSNVFQMDDAYYNLQVARNVAELGFVSFDGIHATSGIQPLWPAMLSVLAFFVQGDVEYLRAVMLLSTLFNAAAGVLLGRLGRRVHGADVGQAAQVLWSGFLLALAPTVIAMEYPIYAFTLLLVLPAVWNVWHRPEEATLGGLTALGVGLAFLYWIRLDSAFFSVGIAGVLGIRLLLRGGRPVVPKWIALTAPGLIGAVGYIALYQSITGTPMPLSGMVKKHYSEIHFEDYEWYYSVAGHTLWFVQSNLRPLLDVFSSGLTETRAWTDPLNLAALAAMLCAAYFTARATIGSDARTRRAGAFSAAMIASGTAHFLLVVISIGHFAHVTQHYYAWALVGWMLAFGLGLEQLSRRWRATPYALLGTFVLLGLPVIALHHSYETHTTSLHRRRPPVIEWIDNELPKDALLGAWNAGQFGYFCDRPVVNLDGLANDREFLEHLRARTPILEYLKREGIGYVVDTHAWDQTMPYGTELGPDDPFRDLLPRDAFEVVWRENDSLRAIVVLRIL